LKAQQDFVAIAIITIIKEIVELKIVDSKHYSHGNNKYKYRKHNLEVFNNTIKTFYNNSDFTDHFSN
jgi:hypothetical protein